MVTENNDDDSDTFSVPTVCLTPFSVLYRVTLFKPLSSHRNTASCPASAEEEAGMLTIQAVPSPWAFSLPCHTTLMQAPQVSCMVPCDASCQGSLPPPLPPQSGFCMATRGIFVKHKASHFSTQNMLAISRLAQKQMQMSWDGLQTLPGQALWPQSPTTCPFLLGPLLPAHWPSCCCCCCCCCNPKHAPVS